MRCPRELPSLLGRMSARRIQPLDRFRNRVVGSGTLEWSGFQRALELPQTRRTPTNRFCQARSKSDAVVHEDVRKLRNIGISAHIDSGKTTLTERILFYTGRIDKMHEVRGKDGVGALMDSMDLEREKGITIQSAATYTTWGDNNINIIDTPGHVDFTIEVERALRVLDGAIMVLCGVGGVQSQSITVDRQMKRYGVARIAFINKLDRVGADPWKVIADVRDKLKLNAAAVQINIGLEDTLEGVVDVVERKAYYFEGSQGEKVRVDVVPENLVEQCNLKRAELVEHLAEVDDEIAELFLMEEDVDAGLLKKSIRRSTLKLKFVPVFMGSAFKNRGVQPLLDGVIDYLPAPNECKNECINLQTNEKVVLSGKNNQPLVALAFKLDEGRFGQLTYIRVYQGVLTKGQFIKNTRTGKRVKVPRVVRMHSAEMEDVTELSSGEIGALFGVECNTGDSFCDEKDESSGFTPSLMNMYVPNPVISLGVRPKNPAEASGNFSKALQRFMKEDPTFRVSVDPQSKETIISGMGELHLEIYLERMRAEYNVDLIAAQPTVNYCEAITAPVDFNYLHKKQTGGSGQFGRVVGRMAPISLEDEDGTQEDGSPVNFIFENAIVGNAIPPEFIKAVEKGFEEQLEKGLLLGQPVKGIRVTLTDGQAHAVDSSEMAFKLAAAGAFRDAFKQANPIVLEPIMDVEVEVPDEFVGTVVAGLNKRRGVIQDTIMRGGFSVVKASVPLAEMFGYSTTLRSSTQAKGEFTMEFKEYQPVNRSQQDELVKSYRQQQQQKK